MALHRSASSPKSSRNEAQREDSDMENNGYIQVFVKPLEQGNYSVILGWLGLNRKLTTQQSNLCFAIGGLLSTVLLYRLIFYDLGYIFSRLCGLLVPVFSIICGFYWISLYLRKTWSSTSVYLLFCACYAGEFIGQCCVLGYNFDSEGGLYITRPMLVGVVLLSASIASIFASLDSFHSTLVIVAVSFTRFLACTTLNDLPQSLRPFLAYTSGIAGVILSKYMETIFKPQINHFMTPDGKIPVIKRRRSSSSSGHGFTVHHRAGRRTSLPALIQKGQGSSSSYEAALISEAHGLISDMLADAMLPPHVVSGLKSVSNLLKPPETQTPASRPRVSPLVSLTETSSYGSDNEDSPYTGERPSSLPKRLRRSLPPSLIRRMSTSTWTTTTSATGMPTLEPEPCRTRTSSFRHNRDGTPGSSPVNSRSNSPSPSSPTTISLTIPKSRSFSVASMGTCGNPNQKRFMKDRKSFLLHTDTGGGLGVNIKADAKGSVSPLVIADSKTDASKSPGAKDTPSNILAKRLNITSDYESSDSPSSSDHSDNVITADEGIGSSPKSATVTRVEGDTEGLEDSTLQPEEEDVSGEDRSDLVHTRDITDSSESNKAVHDTSHRVFSEETPFSIEDINSNQLLHVAQLNQWDYPIFEMAHRAEFSILSQVAYKLFTEVGLFDTFRIPLREFLYYFHALELGYRDKPYHNRVHATDVLHGVYYLTTQPIPGFCQVNPEDIFGKHGSSSESDSEMGDKTSCTVHRPSFTAEDTYGIMGGNFPALELMALYTAAAMHDYDHPGRTNAFLVATHAPQAILYNDRSVLENHHAASAWSLFLSDKRFNWLCGLDKAEFKRFRFLVIEAILATDLKRHFEMLAEFNAKVNDDDAAGIDWTSEADRLMASNMVIKLADINGPCKHRDLHVQWTYRITEEFYEQGDEESHLGLPISPYMDRQHAQLEKLQESFINHLVAPLCNAMAAAGLLPGTWVEECSDTEGASDTDKGGSSTKDTEDEDTEPEIVGASPRKLHTRVKKIHCLLTKHLKENHDMWVEKLKEEAAAKAKDNSVAEEPAEEEGEESDDGVDNSVLNREVKPEMEPIKEEDTPPSSGKLEEGTAPRDFGASVFTKEPKPDSADIATADESYSKYKDPPQETAL